MSKELLDSNLEDTIEILNDNSVNVDFQDNLGRTALFYADVNKSLYLIWAGADLFHKDKKGMTAFDYTVRKAELDLERLDKQKIILFLRMGLNCYLPKDETLKEILFLLVQQSREKNLFEDLLRDTMLKNFNKK